MPLLNNSSINSQADNIGVDYSNAVLTIYDGTPPVDANAALSGNIALVSHTLTGFGASVLGVIIANAIANSLIDASGIASFARLVQATETMQITVGLTNSELIVDNLNYVTGELSIINSLSITQPST